jgi:hypothetical protein
LVNERVFGIDERPSPIPNSPIRQMTTAPRQRRTHVFQA